MMFIQHLINSERLFNTQSRWLQAGESSAGNLWECWLLMEGIHAEIRVVSETRIPQGNSEEFSNLCWDEREVSPNLQHINSPKNDIKSSLGYFLSTGTLPMSLYCILKIWGKFPCGNTLSDSIGKGCGNIHIENSPLFLLNFRTEIMRKFLRGWSPGILQ